MVFSSPIFLCLFLPTLFGCYFLAPIRLRNLVLLLFSLIFYAWGEPRAVWVMLALTLLNYLLAWGVGSRGRAFYLAVSVVLNLAVLFFYKYLVFFSESLLPAAHWLGWDFQIPGIRLPIGISFYVFQLISYQVDVYRREVCPQRNPLTFMMYVCLFSQLIAGPIVRYSTIVNDLANRRISFDNLLSGLRRFALGLAKKVLIADAMAAVADCVFSVRVESVPCVWCWVGAIAYTLQIYFDFSGYSDMAIGLGRMFNFHFLENFDYPYSACSIRDFWRRWHISLSTWFRDYLYIPLGGNRSGTARTLLNLFLVFLLCGAWHGAAWTFVVWGIYHGVGIVLERFCVRRNQTVGFSAIGNMLTMLFVIVGWVIFRASSVNAAFIFLRNMFCGNPQVADAFFPVAIPVVSVKMVIVMVSGVVLSYPRVPQLFARLNEVMKLPLEFLILVVAFIFAVTSSFSPFIYFRF